MKRFALFCACCALAVAAALALAAGGAALVPALATSADPLAIVFLAAAALAAVSFIFGLATRDYSWVDRLWSLAPVFYCAYWAARCWPDPRAILMAALVLLWGARLTANFAAKGGYSGSEDYRWSVLRGRIRNPLAWQAFNLGFICCYQLGLIALFCAPMEAFWLYPAPALDAPILACAAGFLGFLALEAAADARMARFQAAKAARARGGDFDRGFEAEAAAGFISSGPYRYSRHPNYLGEMGQWWTLALAGYAASGSPLALAGAALLTLLFVGSTGFTESISAAKYPLYAEYRRRVSPIIPWPPKEATEEGENA